MLSRCLADASAHRASTYLTARSRKDSAALPPRRESGSPVTVSNGSPLSSARTSFARKRSASALVLCDSLKGWPSTTQRTR